MSEHNGPSDDATQPVRLHKDGQPAHTDRIPTTSETQRFQRPPESSTYYSPLQYGSAPPAAPGQHQPMPPQGPPRPSYPMQTYAPTHPPAYNTAVMTSGRPAASGVVIALAWILAIVTFFYLLPWAIAATRNKSNQGPIFLVNFLLGWSFIGWVVALVMACGAEPQSNVMVVNNVPPPTYYR